MNVAEPELVVPLPLPDRRSPHLSAFARVFASDEEVSQALARGEAARAILRGGYPGALVTVVPPVLAEGGHPSPPDRMTANQARHIAAVTLPRRLGLAWEEFENREGISDYELFLRMGGRFARWPFVTIVLGLFLLLGVSLAGPVLPLSENAMALGVALPCALFLYAAVEERHYRCAPMTHWFGVVFPLAVVLMQGDIARGAGKWFLLLCAYTMLAFHFFNDLGQPRHVQ